MTHTVRGTCMLLWGLMHRLNGCSKASSEGSSIYLLGEWAQMSGWSDPQLELSQESRSACYCTHRMVQYTRNSFGIESNKEKGTAHTHQYLSFTLVTLYISISCVEIILQVNVLFIRWYEVTLSLWLLGSKYRRTPSWFKSTDRSCSNGLYM